MKTIENRVKKLESDVGTKEPSLIITIQKVAPREQWRPPADNCPSGLRLEWIDPEDFNISH
jgi:hypothetical protein